MSKTAATCAEAGNSVTITAINNAAVTVTGTVGAVQTAKFVAMLTSPQLMDCLRATLATPDGYKFYQLYIGARDQAHEMAARTAVGSLPSDIDDPDSWGLD